LWADIAALALVKPTAFAINTASGAPIDQDALAGALDAGRIAGLALMSSTQNCRLPSCGCCAWSCHLTWAASLAKL